MRRPRAYGWEKEDPTGSLGAVQRRGKIPLTFFVLSELSVWFLDRISTVVMSVLLLSFCSKFAVGL